MSLFSTQALLEVGDETYSWGDAIGAAGLRGEWAPLVSRAEQGLAMLDGDEAGQLSDAVIAKQAEAFRYERNLETAEEMEAWLERWQLSIVEWTDWIAAECLRRRAQPNPGPAAADPFVIARAVHAELVCSRQAEHFALRLAERAAVRAWRSESGAPEPALGRTAVSPTWACEVDPRALARLARDEASFRAFLAEEMCAKAKETEIVTRRLDWSQLSYEIALFESADAAQEASLTIREDGLTLREAASAAGATFESHAGLVEEIDDSIRGALLGARSREVVGPIRARGGWQLILVVDRQPASIADPELRARAGRAVRNRILVREGSNRVRWRWRL